MTRNNTTDYSVLLDPETHAFVELTETWYPPDTMDFSIQRQREIYNAMCKAFHQGYPACVQTIDSVINSPAHSVGIRRYVNKESVSEPNMIVVYFPGGGFVVGGLESHDDVCAEICERTGYEVVSVDYRLSPEFDHPAAFQDALLAVQSISGSTSKSLILCGDSAGGNLAAAVTHASRGGAISLAGQLLIYPSLGSSTTVGSFVTHANAPMLSTRDVDYYLNIRKGATNTDNDPTFAPLCDPNFTHLPATVVFSAECDPLCDDGELYVNKVGAAGGRAHWVREAGLVHGYLRARSTVSRARDSFSRIINNIKMLGNREWHH